MATNSDSNTSYLDKVVFQNLESETLLRLSNQGERFRGHGDDTFVCLFCHGKKLQTWSICGLLQHSEGNSRLGEGRSDPKHSALAKYILTNDAMARDRELAKVGDYGGNEVVKARRDLRHAANRADREERKNKVLNKKVCVMIFFRKKST